MTDTDTSRLLREATRDLVPDVEGLVSGGVDRGRRLRRRRRVGATLAAAAVVGVIGTAASVAPAVLASDGDSRGSTPAATQPTSEASETPTPAPDRVDGPGVEDNADPWTDLDREQMPGALAGLLPDGEVTDPRFWPRDQATGRTLSGGEVELTLEDFWGTSGFYQGGSVALDGSHVTVLVGADGDDVDWTMEDNVYTCQETPGGTCVELPGGSWMATSTQHDDQGKNPTGVVVNEVTVWRPDGASITVSAYNAPGEDGPPTQGAPVLSPAELEQIALDPVWFNGP